MEYVRELDTRAAGTAATQSALKVHRLTFMEAAMLVVGSTIGSGVLGLAYASRLAGWPVPFVWLVVAGIFSGISMLYVAETALRTQEPLQLSGLAEKYVGRIGSWLIFFLRWRYVLLQSHCLYGRLWPDPQRVYGPYAGAGRHSLCCRCDRCRLGRPEGDRCSRKISQSGHDHHAAAPGRGLCRISPRASGRYFLYPLGPCRPGF